jgi:transposase InsO family protein
MPWKKVTVMEEKEKFIETYKSWKGSFRILCKQFGISTKTGYKLINRYNQLGQEGLKEQSRRPKCSPNKTKLSIENLLVKTRQLYPGWGGEKIKHYLEKKGYKELPREKTIDRILKRYGLITAEESEKHKSWKRFEHENPNDLWQMDFKGHFKVGERRCHPLTLLDDHSRYSLLIKACENERKDTVETALIEVFREYGLPRRMTMDNGSPWGYSGDQMYTTLSAWLIRLGIYVSHSRPNHPQTQGKLERFHRTLKLELLKGYSFANLEEAQEGFDGWRKLYNEERPHAAINYDVPLKRYRASERCYPQTLLPIEYDESFIVRKVQQDGIIYYKGKEYRVGQAFGGNRVGLKESDDGLIDVFFCHQRVVKIDLRFPIN